MTTSNQAPQKCGVSHFKPLLRRLAELLPIGTAMTKQKAAGIAILAINILAVIVAADLFVKG